MEESDETQRYYIELEGADQRNRSVSGLIAERRCRECRQADTRESLADAEAQDHIKRIVEQCAHTSDYLLPDTPMKEALFRVILQGGNEPTSAIEISEILSERWGMTAYPRDVSPAVIERILQHGQTYSIAAIPRPVTEEEPEAVEQTPEVESSSDEP